MKDFRPPGRTRTSETTCALAARAALMAVLAVAPAAPACAQAPAFLVKDINPRTMAVSSNPRDFFTIGRITFFIAGKPFHDSLWKTDGNADGTQPLSSDLEAIDALTNVGAVLFFTVSSGQHHTLWKSDGSREGTVPIREIGGRPQFSTGVGDTLFFFVADDQGFALWRSDGTPARTEPLKRFNSYSDHGGFCGPNVPGQVNGRLFFFGGDTATGCEPWSSDATSDGTMILKDIAPGTDSSHSSEILGTLGESLFFAVRTGSLKPSLWATDGTPAGTRLVSDVVSPETGFGRGAVLGDALYFRGVTLGQERPQLWKTNGTTAGTVLVRDVAAAQLIAGTEHLYFAAFEGAVLGLWTSDGTPQGTMQVIDAGPAGFELLATAGDLLFLSLGASELWRSDGTADGTYALVMLDRGSGTGTQLDPQLVAGDTEAFFLTRNATNALELWRSDGTLPGTIHLGDLDFNRGDLHLAGSIGPLFFAGYDSDAGQELWTSDGTPDGTQQLANLAPDTIPQSSFASGLTNLNGTLLFTAYDGRTGSELWRSDGTEAGTVLVKDINPGPASAYPLAMYLGGDEGGVVFVRASLGDTLFFPADDGAHGNELWRTDGTSAGTYMVADIIPGPDGSYPDEVVDLGGTLYFTAAAGLWKSDGTAAATVKIKSFSLAPSALTPFDGHLFFAVGSELWRSDGTIGGTELVHDFGPSVLTVSGLAVANDALFIGTGFPMDLWKSDGTAEGTVLLKHAANQSFPGGFTVADDVLFFIEFRAFYVTFPVELWRSDGTPDGTLAIGPTSGRTLAALGGALFFASPDGLLRTDGTVAGTSLVSRLTFSADDLTTVDGHVLFQSNALWESDGTATGTRRLADLSVDPPIAGKLNQASLTRVGSLVFFTASSPSTGVELWAVPVASLGVCGNQEVDPGETCDAGGETISCNADCTARACGDGIVNATAGEICDDGNTLDGDCCTSTCTAQSGQPCGTPDVCDGIETCNDAGACVPGTPLDCDDGDRDTLDSCDARDGCLHTAIPTCVGDCSGDGIVTIDELLSMVAAMLGDTNTACVAGDADRNGGITVDETITAVTHALRGCAASPAASAGSGLRPALGLKKAGTPLESRPQWLPFPVTCAGEAGSHYNPRRSRRLHLLAQRVGTTPDGRATHAAHRDRATRRADQVDDFEAQNAPAPEARPAPRVP
jgi:ELWxxDGT repeat protein/cysteine-rich repeat protein